MAEFFRENPGSLFLKNLPENAQEYVAGTW